jgi:DNA polymerase-3 subunit delta'
MAFTAFAEQQDIVALLQRSLDRGRLGHAYLFSGPDLPELETAARTLAKTLSCERPPRRGASGLALDCCDVCLSCRKIDEDTHPDVMWVRPESKLRQIRIGQFLAGRPDSAPRPLLPAIYVKPTQAANKFGIIAGADRMNESAANCFLKTLEEPPADSLFILLTTEPQRLLETILSRCLRLNFAGEASQPRDPAVRQWLAGFAAMAGAEQKSLLVRYRLLAVLLNRLGELKAATEERLTQESPLQKYDDVEPGLKEKWEDELDAAIASEYRRQRADLLNALHWWLRDVWLHTMQVEGGLAGFPELAAHTQAVARRISTREAQENLALLERTQRLLTGNVQEALALEVGLLKLKL